MGRRAERGWAWALVASLALHALGWWWLSSRHRAPERAAPVASHAVEFDLVTLPPPTPPPPRLTPEPAAVRPHRGDTAHPRPAVAPVATTPRADPGPTTSSADTSPAGTAEGVDGSAHDVPWDLARLLPSERGVVLPFGMEGPRGHTRRATDPQPDPAAALAAEGARVRQFVQGFAEDQLATGRVTNGLVSPYFDDLRHELNLWAQKPPEVFDGTTPGLLAKQLGQTLWNQYAEGAARAGATGSPYADPAGWRPEVPSQMAQMATQGDQMAAVGKSVIERGARLREFADGRMGTDLVAVVELRQSARGELQSALLLEGSGVKRYDEWVLSSAGNAVDSLSGEAPDAGVGIHEGGLRSVWAFRGRISFMRSVGKIDPARDAWYVVLAAPLGLATGTFDEVLGTWDYVDLRTPHYECTVKLLQVY